MDRDIAAERELLSNAYAAFNARHADGVLQFMTSDVRWPRAFKGGHVEGPEAVRAYWTEQWSEIHATVQPLGFTAQSQNSVLVEVALEVRDLEGNLLAIDRLGHLYTFEDGLIRQMDLVSLEPQ